MADDIAARIRSEADTAARSGQAARLDEIAAEVDDLVARAVEAETGLVAAHAVIRRTSTWLDLLAGDVSWSDAEAAAIRAATADPTPEPETS